MVANYTTLALTSWLLNMRLYPHQMPSDDHTSVGAVSSCALSGAVHVTSQSGELWTDVVHGGCGGMCTFFAHSSARSCSCFIALWCTSPRGPR